MLDYFAVSESSIFTVFSNVIYMRIIKTPEVFKALPWSPLPRSLRPAADFNYVFCFDSKASNSALQLQANWKTLICSTTYFICALTSK